jgi:hypothetical protein
VWVHGSDSDYYERLRELPPPGGVLEDEGVYAIGSSRAPTRDEDGVVPIPGQDLLLRDRRCYWVTGVVGSQPRPMGSASTQEFLLVAGSARFVARMTLKPEDRVGLGERVTVECMFELVASHDWSAFDLGEDWGCDWRIEQIIRPGSSPGWDFIVDLAATTAVDP